MNNISSFWIGVFIIAAVWELYWKGRALWHAARRNQATWFVLLLIINSAGILPILYLYMSGAQDEDH